MRVLYYNWVDYLDPEKRGGGVSLYQRNLMREIAESTELEAVFLSSGTSYDPLQRGIRWEEMRHGPQKTAQKRYEIINSGVIAPGHASYGNPAQVDHAQTAAVFFDFIAQTGPYDVVHFNNLEGLPAEALALKARWPETKVIFSLHNYYPFCSQVNLWHQERENCLDFEGGRKCADCLLHQYNPQHITLAHGLAYRLKRAGLDPESRAYRFLFTQAMRAARRLVAGLGFFLKGLRKRTPRAAPVVDGAPYRARRTRMMELINTQCDRVLCVSESVADMARQYGVRANLVETSYIGTLEAARFAQTQARGSLVRPDGTVTLGYLGYMRRDKGFFFLLEALERLPEALASRVHLLVAARRGCAQDMARLEALAPRLASLKHVDGYTHDGLDALLAGVDVGVIPVLWADNLPQVAIEMHARHIPLLTSDLGGAHELSQNPNMVFAAGDHAAFEDRLRAILAQEINMQDYWAGAQAPVTMPAHMKALEELYRKRA